MRLYEIYDEMEKCVDQETGEIIDTEKLAELEMSLEEKKENVACWIKNLRADAKCLKDEADALTKRRKAAENKADSLENYLTLICDGQGFSTPRVAVGFRKSESVKITDMTAIPMEFLRFKDPEADKTEIKKALKAGKAVAGAELETKQNIQVK